MNILFKYYFNESQNGFYLGGGFGFTNLTSSSSLYLNSSATAYLFTGGYKVIHDSGWTSDFGLYLRSVSNVPINVSFV